MRLFNSRKSNLSRSGTLTSGSFLFSRKKKGFFLKIFFSLLTILSITGGMYFKTNQALGTNYTFIETNWSGGQTINIANHTNNQTGWNQYSAKDTNITPINSGADLALTNSIGSTNVDFNTEGDYSQQDATNGTDFSGTQVALHRGVSNIALNKTCVASGQYNPCSNLFNGNLTDGWNSGDYTGWIYVDLGSVYDISQIRFMRGAGTPIVASAPYTLEVSATTPSSFVQVAAANCGYSTWTTWTGSTQARYVRLYMGTTASWVIVNELEVSGYNYPITPYYVTTAAASQKNTSTWGSITSITTAQTTPANTDIKYLVSFDNRSTWKYWNGSSWQTSILGNININGMNKSAIEALSQAQWAATGGFIPGTLDFAASLSTADASVSPTLDNISTNYALSSEYLFTDVNFNTEGDYLQQDAVNGTDFNGAQATLHAQGVVATGGTIIYTDSSGLNPRTSPAYAGGYTVHTFTSSGTFTASLGGNVAALVVGGGGSGANSAANVGGGGGGAGGYQYNANFAINSGSLNIVVGQGGTADNNNATASSFSTITANAGGSGGGATNNGGAGYSGASGGGSAGSNRTTGTGNQGSNGGIGYGVYGSTPTAGGGGGGASGNGAAASGYSVVGTGGSGIANSISGTTLTYSSGGNGGIGSGGSVGSSGAPNSGNGGVGGGGNTAGGNGGSGIVIIKYPSDATYPTTPYYITTNSASQKDTSSWTSMTGVTITQSTSTNTNLKYLVSFDNQTTWKYWNGSAWTTSALGSIATNGMTKANIEAITQAQWSTSGGFTPGTLDFAASLSSTDATVTPTLDNIQISYALPQTQALTSSVYNTQLASSNLSKIQWTETLPTNTDVKFQLRTSSDGTTWGPWCGPDDATPGSCTSTTYFTSPTGIETIDDIQRDRANDQYFQYKAYLASTDGVSTPTLSDVSVSYDTIIAPTVTTSSVSNTTSYSAQGNGNITNAGGENLTAYIEWGTTNGGPYPNSCSAGVLGTGVYSCNLTGLSPNTTYYVKAYATNSAGTGYGSELNFTTPALPIITINNPNTNPAQSKTLSASADKGTLNQSITTGILCDNSLTFTAYTSTTFSTEADNGKKVCYRSVDATSGTSYLMSSPISGIDTTPPTISANNSSANWQITGPTITLFTSDETSLNYSKYDWDTDDSTCRTSGTTFINGSTTSIISQGTHTLYLCNQDSAVNNNSWNGTYKLDTQAPSITDVSSNCQNITDPTFTITASDSASGLDMNPYSFDGGTTWQSENSKTYQDFNHNIPAYSIQVKDAAGNIASYNSSKSQSCVQGASVTTSPISNIKSISATGNGNISDIGGENPERLIEWGTTTGIYTHSCSASTGPIGSYSCNLTNLAPATSYYLRAKATNSAATTYGNETTFTTLPDTITIIDPNTAKVDSALSSGYVSLSSGSITNTDQVTTNANVIVRSSKADLLLPVNTQITNTNTGSFNFQSFTNQDVTSAVKITVGSSKAAVKIGVPNTQLSFTNPVTLAMEVGTGYNGQAMDILYQEDNESAWHSQGSCIITNGKCTFTTDHATTYTVNFDGTMSGDTGINLNTDIQEIISLDCGGATVNLSNLTPGTPVTGSSTCLATTNANGGYTLSVKRDDASGATMDKDTEPTTEIPDKTEWTPGTPNAITWTGTGLGFTVYSSTATKNNAWWGTGTTVNDGNNLYAGFPASQANIMVHNSYSDVSTATAIGYKLDVAPTQKSGAYSGAVTYEVTTSP